MSTRTKIFNVYGKAIDSKGEKHYVTVVGKFEQTRNREVVQEVVDVEVKPNTFVDGILTYQPKKMRRTLTLGMSICHPLDEFNEAKGVEIALGRINKGENLGVLETNNITMLTDDAIEAELIVKLNHICENINEYISD
jgi:hypothetical protein